MLANSDKQVPCPEEPAQSHAEHEHSLRAARELQQLTVDDVANVLHLSREHIVALETGDFARLGPQVFVRGYLRSYARLLGLPEQSVLADPLLGNMVPEEFKTMSLSVDLKPGFYLRAWMGWALLGLVLLIAAVVFLANTLDADNERAAANDGAAKQATPVIAASAAGNKAVVNSAPRPRFTVVESGLAPAGLSLPRVAVAAADTRVEPAAGVKTEAEAEAEAEAVSDSQAEAVAAPAEAVIAETPPIAAVAAGKVRLTLSFSDECWVEIADSQRSLLYGLEKRGAVVSLDGVPPFKLFFGNRKAVQMAVAGKPFVIPVGASDSGNTTRFIIKEDQLQ